MSFPRLLPLALVSLTLAAASTAEARSTRAAPWSWAALSNRIQSIAHIMLRTPIAFDEPRDQDESSNTPVMTWGRIKAGYREGTNPPPGKD